MKKSVTENHIILVEVYGKHTLSKQSIRRWFGSIKSGDFELEYKERAGKTKPSKRKRNETITGERYRTQLVRLSRALEPEYEERHDKEILQNDKSRAHVAKAFKIYLKTQWEVQPHPALFSRHRSFRLLLVSLDDTWHVPAGT